MANIHDFREHRQQNYTNSQDNEEEGPVGVFQESRYMGDPRQESFPQFMKESICPTFKLKSASFVIIILNFLIYIISLTIHGLDPVNKEINFLPPSSLTLDQMGALSGKKLRENFFKNLYRWIANSFLHADFMHIFSNTLGILILGTVAERLIGTLKFALIYIIGGIIGSLFSVICDKSSSSVGASISIFAIVGTHFAFCAINWSVIDRYLGPGGLCMWVSMLIIFTFISLIFAFSSHNSMFSSRNNINAFGHLGGLLAGFFFCFTIVKPESGDFSVSRPLDYKYLRIIGICVCGIFAVVGFLCFYLIKNNN